MKAHTFIFESGFWEGAGEISFSMSEDVMPFAMTWEVKQLEKGEIQFTQTLDVEGIPEKMQNAFILSNLKEERFAISLSNDFVGEVSGLGLFDEGKIAWEFRNPNQQFQGFEVYEKQEDGYTMRAEFTSGDGLRTFVKGHIKRL